MCCDTNVDGKIDYVEFTERFHNPAKEIGFNLAVLLTNLSEHMPSDPRLARFLEVSDFLVLAKKELQRHFILTIKKQIKLKENHAAVIR